MRNLRRVAIGGGVIAALAGLGVWSYLAFSGPRMDPQPHLRAFQAALATMPADTVAVTDAISPPPTPAAAETLTSPLTPTPANLQRGKVYYGYYCAFCHGQAGDGSGPVGRSFVPDPADLRAAKVAQMPDGKLLRAMLTGPGHEPVLPRVVHPEHRWYLVLYTRHLGGGAGSTKR